MKNQQNSGTAGIILFAMMLFAAICANAQSGVFVSADKMNILYIGVDNPLTIVVPGYASDKIRPEISNGTLTKTSEARYIARVTSGPEAIINVSAVTAGGTKFIGSSKFRVKSIPSPIPMLAGRPGGNYLKTEIIASPYISAVLENFDFDLRYNVISYTFTMKNSSGDLIDIPGTGYMLTPNMISLIQRSVRGDRFWIENIVAEYPGGTKMIGSISARIS